MGEKLSLQKPQSSFLLGCLMFALGAVTGLALIHTGSAAEDYRQMFYGLLTVWVFNLAFCCFNIKQRMIALLFHLTVFLFLISRIAVSELRGYPWWEYYSMEANGFAITAIAYSLMAICVGVLAMELLHCFLTKKGERPLKSASERKWLQIDKEALRFVVRAVLIVCMASFFLRELDKLLYMRGKDYAEYYKGYVPNVPSVVDMAAGCMPFFLCMLLALKPGKKETLVWLGAYVASAVPMLIIGARGDFVLNVVFAFAYYCLRSMAEKGWFGKLEIAAIIIAVPLAVIFLGAYEYIRSDKALELSPVETVVDFAYKQGTTYDTVLQGYQYQDQIIGKEYKNFTFAPLTDYVLYSSLGEKLFEAPDVGSGNCLRAAYRSSSFAHNISYIVYGSDYIAGHGRGSSYIIETYLDFGYGGLILFSFLLGMLCSGSMVLFGKRWFGSVIILNMLTDLFFIARAEATSFLVFLVSYKFWVMILLALIGAIIVGLLIRRLELKRYKVIRTVLEF